MSAEAERAAASSAVGDPGRLAQMRGRLLHHAVTWVGLLVSAVFAYFAVRNVRYGDVWDGLPHERLLVARPRVSSCSRLSVV